RGVSGLASQRLRAERDARQAMDDQRTDVAVVAAVGRCDDRAIMLAEGQQGFFVAQAFQQSQAQRLARAFVLACGVLHRTVAERLRLVVIVRSHERQGVGEYVFATVEAGAQGVQVSHVSFPWQTRPAGRRWLLSDKGISTRCTACHRPLRGHHRG
nr:hypothetical protein [Tanacetum cinerariifolium]